MNVSDLKKVIHNEFGEEINSLNVQQKHKIANKLLVVLDNKRLKDIALYILVETFNLKV